MSNFVVNVALGELAVAEFDFVTDKAISILCHDIEFTVTTFLRQIVGVATDLEKRRPDPTLWFRCSQQR